MFSGKTVVVTGGARNLGEAACRAFAEAGARVVLVDEDGAGARLTANNICAEVGDTTQVVPFHVDVSDREAVNAFAERVHEEYGPVAALVNNAGIALSDTFESDLSPEVWDRTIAINLTGMFNASHAFLPALKDGGGAVVNMASVAGLTSGTTNAGYSASKGGVIALTRKLARELAQDGIRVNAVAPGYMDTPRPGRSVDGEALQEILDWHCPMRRLGKPHEVAQPIVFLCSPGASYITGVTLPIDGGFLTI